MVKGREKHQTKKIDAETAGYLSSIWILASNDENPLITYQSIRQRLGLDRSYPIEDLVRSRSELFRQGTTTSRLASWKQEMREGRNVPTWIKALQADKQLPEIEKLESWDVFRSQFRVNLNAPKSSVDIIEWGLQHIERLRKASDEESEKRSRRFRDSIIPAISLAIALVTVLSTAYMQYRSLVSQEDLKKAELEAQQQLKKFEVSYAQRSEGYATLMGAFESAVSHAQQGESESIQKELRQMQLSYYKLRPFMSKESQLKFAEKLTAYSDFLFERNSSSLDNSKLGESKETVSFRLFFSNVVYEEAFEKSIFANTPVVSPVQIPIF